MTNPLAFDAVDVWWVDINALLPGCPQFAEYLSPEESARASRFVRSEDRSRFIVSHGALRCVLAQYLSVTPVEVEFGEGPHGKPRLVHGDLEFNLSHSAGQAVVAVARRPVGIDVEHIRPIAEMDSIIERFFAPREREFLAMVDARERTVAFYRCWCRKEAYVKATGQGLSLDPSSFSVSIDPERPSLLQTAERASNSTRWSFGNLAVPDGYAGAVAVDGPLERIRERAWTAASKGIGRAGDRIQQR